MEQSHFIIMITLALFFVTVHADDYWKTICLCKPSDCSDYEARCKGQPTLDPTSPTFISDFNYIRKNIKNIDLYINSARNFDFAVDMRNIAGLTLNISSRSAYVDLTLTYVNGEDYGGNFFYFRDKYVAPKFIPISDSQAENVLRIGILDALESDAEFHLNNGKKTILKYDSLLIPTSAYKNISGLNRVNPGDLGLRIADDDRVSVKISKSSANIIINGVQLALTIGHGDVFKVSGLYKFSYRYNDSLIVTIDDGVTFSDLPLIQLEDISIVEFKGKYWKPSASIPIQNINNVAYLTIPSGDFPFSIYASNIMLNLAGDTTIYGNIDAVKASLESNKLTVTTSLTKRVNLSIKGYVDSTISVQSPYLNINIDNYAYNGTDTWNLPIGFSFNEEMSSYVYVKNFSYRSKPSTNCDRFESFPTITNVLTDEELDSKPIKKGFVFLDLPPNTLTSTTFRQAINSLAPSVIESVPGFVSSGNCMSIVLEKSGRTRLKAYKSKTAYSLPSYLCITTGSVECQNSYTYPYININDFDGDVAKYVKKGIKEIYISTSISSKDIAINFNNLEEKKYNITLVGRGSYYSTYYSITNDNDKIQNFIISYAKITNGFYFKMPKVEFIKITFDKDKSYSFSSSTKIIVDESSLEALYQIQTKPMLYDVTLKHDFSSFSYYYYDFDETIDIDNGIYKICARGYSGYYANLLEEENISNAALFSSDYCGYDCTAICAKGIDPKYFKKFTVISEYPLQFTITSIQPSTNPINIIINPGYSYYGETYSIKLLGNGWDTKMNEKFTIDNGDSSFTMRVTGPNQADNIKITGSASVLYKVDYPSSKSYCFYIPEAKKTCYYRYSYTQIQEPAENFTNYLPTIGDSSVKIYFDNQEAPYQIPMSFFDKRKISLSSPTSYSDSTASSVEILFNDTKLDPTYSLTEFDIIRTVYTGDKDVNAYFGQLKINTYSSSNWTVDDNWKNHVNLVASQFIGKFSDLYQFKSITITDQMSLAGGIPTEGDEVSVTFKQDNDAYDLVTEVQGEVTITVGKGFIKIGQFKFMISPGKDYDGYIKVTKKSSITIDSSVSAKADLVKFVIDCQSYETNIKFTGSYPEIIGSEESLIMIKGTGKVNITTDSSLPLSVFTCPDVEFHFMTEKVKTITGPIEYVSNSRECPNGRIRFYNHQSKRVSLSITHGFSIKKMESQSNFTGIMSPNIDLEIGKITKASDDIQGTISLISSIGNIGASLISFVEPLPEKITLANTTYVVTQVFGKIKDESIFPFVKEPETIIKAKTNDLPASNMTFNYIVITKDDLTHGFYPGVNCLAINITREKDYYSEVKLFAHVKPSEIPFIIDFVTGSAKTDGELIINDQNIDALEDLNNYLPTVFIGIILRLQRHMEQNHVLNLNNVIKGRPSLSVEVLSLGRTTYEAFITLPTSKSLTIKCNNIKVGFATEGSGSGTFLVKNANFVDCEFMNANMFKFSNEMEEIHMDVDSLNSLVVGGSFNSFPGKVFVDSANVILFTKDGWEFREDRARPTVLISSNMFKDIQFDTSLFCMLMIDDETLDSIHSFKFNAFPDDQGTVLFELSRHWGHIKNLNGFKINVNGATSVNLNTASYPIPKLFEIDDSDISYTLETDVSGKFDTITLENNRLFKDEDLNMNFQFLPSEYQFIEGDKVFFDGNSNINFVNDVGTLRVNESIFKQKSNTTLTRLETLKLMTVDRTAEVTGTFKFSLSSTLQLHWTLTETPILNHKSFEKGSPQWLELIYDESSVDKDLYREKLLRKNGIVLMRGNFECFSVKNNVKFGGGYAPFSAGNTHLNVACDSSAEGQVLLLQGLTDISDDEDDSKSGSGNGAKVSSGGVVGIVIACALIVGVVAAGVVYYYQRIKIDRLKNEIPAENNDAYKTNSYETRETTQSSNDYAATATEDPFDDV